MIKVICVMNIVMWNEVCEYAQIKNAYIYLSSKEYLFNSTIFYALNST